MKNNPLRSSAFTVVFFPCLVSSLQGQSLSYSDSYGPAYTDILVPSHQFTLTGFNPSLGILNSVSISYTGTLTRTIKHEEKGSFSPTALSPYDFEMFTDDALGLVSPAVTASSLTPLSTNNGFDPVTHLATATTTVLNGAVWGNASNFVGGSSTDGGYYAWGDYPVAYDGVKDYGGTSGFTHSYTILTNNATQTYTDGATLAYFTGSTVHLYDLEESQYAVNRSGNASDLVLTQETGSVSVTYNYSPIPEPSGALLGGLGTLGLLFRRRRA